MKRPFAAVLAGVLALASALASVRPFRESDLFWHLSLGRAVLRARARVVPEPYALEAFSQSAVAPEWLWDVAIYGLFRAFSYAAIAVLVVTVAAAIGALLPTLLSAHLPPERRDETSTLAALSLVSPVVLALALARVRERPESLALLLLALTIALATRYFAAETPRLAVRLGLALLGVELLWAQTHPTFVLAPAIVVAASAARPLAELRSDLRRHGALLCALALGLLTSAHGLKVFSNSLAHARGDAVAHIADMAAPVWGTFDPTSSVFGPLYAFAWLVGLGGALLARRIRLDSLLLSVLGLVLVMTAVRGLGPGGLLLGPFALDGAIAIADSLETRRERLLVAAFALVGALSFARAALRLDEQNGPTGHVGLLPGQHPLAAAARLAQGPAGARVFTTFDVGASIGFFADGRARVTIDSRVPLHFDDTEAAVVRDASQSVAALQLALSRYALDVAVVPRESPACPLLAGLEGWEPVLTEPRHTTFARKGTVHAGRRLAAVAPCGNDYLALGVCVQPGAFDDDLAQLSAFDDPSFVGFLRASRAVRCAGPGVQVAAVAALVPSPWESAGYAWPRDELLARLFVFSGNLDAALDTLDPWLAKHPREAVSIVSPLVGRVTHGDDLRRFVARGVVAMTDAVPADVHADLAWLCALDADLECARFHATRAAVGGSALAGRALCRVAHEHREPKARADARAWLDARRRLGVVEPLGDCPP